MGVGDGKRRLSISRLHRFAARLHGGIPRRLFRNGYAFSPLHYMFQITHRCNIRCAMCYDKMSFQRDASKPGQNLEELTTMEWIRLIDGTGRFSIVSFTGGEPWVRDDFAELLEHASRIRRTHYFTNATLLTDRDAKHSAQLASRMVGGRGLNSVGVSLHGPEEVHDHIAGRPDTYAAAVAGVRALARYRDEMGKRCPYIHITTVVQRSTLDSLPDMPALAAAAGADVLNLVREIPVIDLRKFGKMDMDKLNSVEVGLPRIPQTELEAALDSTDAAARRAGIELRMPDLTRDQLFAYYSGGLDPAALVCRGAWTTFNVSAEGHASPGCFMCDAGDCRTGSLRKIWNGDRMRRFRSRLRMHVFPLCQICCLAHGNERNGR